MIPSLHILTNINYIEGTVLFTSLSILILICACLMHVFILICGGIFMIHYIVDTPLFISLSLSFF
jgi:hypothetical protein